MARKSAVHQPSLLDWKPPDVTLCPSCIAELRSLLAGLMGEIGQTLVAVESREGDHEQDNS
jgi:hypothetical protein